MKKLLQVLSVVMSAMLVAGAVLAAPELKTEQEKQSYAIGANLARKLKQQGVSFEVAPLAQGVRDEMSGTVQLTNAEIDAILKKMQNEVRQKQEAAHQKASLENQKRGSDFLAGYVKKDGVIALRGGIYYRVLQAGSGAIPSDDSIVLCNYRGTLVDGTVFDSSPPDKPVSFEVSQVIQGWRRVLRQMPVGSKWEVVIPAGMAYGERGAPPAIGPNETLIFEIELVDIE